VALKDDLKKGISRMNLNLFSDLNLNVIVEKIESMSKDNLVMTGRLPDQPFSSVTMSVQNDVLVANVHPTAKTYYTITYQSDGIHRIQEFAADTTSDEENCLAIPAPDETEMKAQDLADTQALAAPPVIDMLVGYTPAAKTKAGGADAIKALIQAGIADTNKAFLNSGVNLSVRLVGIMAMSQNETNDFSADLSSLRGKTDGLWDSVHAERALLGADQVTIVGSYPNNSVAGIGYIKAAASSAFTIAKVSAFKIFTFTHELGHNVGLNHSDGLENASGGFRTVMAYGTYTRIARFSNPSLPYDGYSTGDSSHNSAKILNANGSATANLVAAKITSSPEEIPVNPETSCNN
jgi:hypothetical protein